MNERMTNKNSGISPFGMVIMIMVIVFLTTALMIALLVNASLRTGGSETTAPDPSLSNGSTVSPDTTAEPGTSGEVTGEKQPETTDTPNTTVPETTQPETPEETSPPIDPNQKLIAFSFDDGPHATYTLELLEVLEKYNAHATFFVVGSHCTRSGAAEAMQKTVAAGHEIASHTYSHTNLTTLTAAQIREEEQKTADIIYKNCGVYPTLMRAPGGAFNDSVLSAVSYPLIRWSVDTLDWSHKDPQQTLQILKDTATDGGIVLMHDRVSNTAETVELCFEWLYANGYKVVSVSELMEAKGVTMEAGKVYYSSYRVFPNE